LDMFWRETLGWRMIDGDWKIVHAHSSVPFNPATGMASTGLKPA
jgi:ketosteroid isomerase-like protein